MGYTMALVHVCSVYVPSLLFYVYRDLYFVYVLGKINIILALNNVFQCTPNTMLAYSMRRFGSR